MEEERRLCYVAITRAKKRLFLSGARQRMLFGRTTANRVSRFIDEIPEEHLEKRNIPRGYGYSERSQVQKEFAFRAPSRPEPQEARCAARPRLSPRRPGSRSSPSATGCAIGPLATVSS